MAKTLTFKLLNCRAIDSFALMGFDLAVGYTTEDRFVGVLEIRGCLLKRKRDGSSNFVSFPAKLRTTRDGAAATDENGYKIYDNIVDLYAEVGANAERPDSRSVTEAGWGFRKWLIDEATTAYEQLAATEKGRGKAAPAGGPPRGGSKPVPAAAPKARPAAAATRVADVPVETAEDDGEDWPF